jgi:SPP1 gp7 family putative phage head morphogenesis protein
MPTFRDARGKRITLNAVRPNVGIAAGYRAKLLELVRQMIDSYDWFIRAQYKKSPPLAQDAAAADLDRELKKLSKRWRENFTEASEGLAKYFAKAAANRSDAQLRSILKKGGWTVKFDLTPQMRDVLDAAIVENVGLIKSIPERFHTEVEGLVMRSVSTGRNVSTLTRDLEDRYRITRKRAELIARDQNNKATGAFQRARQLEIGITEAIWLHSGGGKEPRPTHVRNSGKRFSVARGWYDPAVKKYIQPGELINCRCVSRPVVKGFS